MHKSNVSQPLPGICDTQLAKTNTMYTFEDYWVRVCDALMLDFEVNEK